MLSQTKQSLLKLIDDEHRTDMKSMDFKSKMVEQTLKNTHKTRSHLLHLIQNINSKIDNVGAVNCDQSKQPGLLPSSEILSMENKITDVQNLYENLKYLLHSSGIKGKIYDEATSDATTSNTNTLEEETCIAKKIEERI